MASMRVTVAAGPAAQRRLLVDVAAGRVSRGPNGVSWVERRTPRGTFSGRVSQAALQALVDDGLVRLVGDRWEACDVA